MSLNALVPSSIVQKASSSAVAPIHSFVSGAYAGLSSAVYEEIIGVGTLAANGRLIIPLTVADFPSIAYAAACIVEVWRNNAIAGAAVPYGLIVGIINFGAPPNLTIEAQTDAGLLTANAFTVAYRLLLPRKVV